MSKTREQFVQVMVMASEYRRKNRTGFTVDELHQFMSQYGDWDNPVKQRTIRRCLNDLVDRNIIKKKELSNSALYVVHEPALLPQPAEIIGSTEDVVEFSFSAEAE